MISAANPTYSEGFSLALNVQIARSVPGGSGFLGLYRNYRVIPSGMSKASHHPPAQQEKQLQVLATPR